MADATLALDYRATGERFELDEATGRVHHRAWHSQSGRGVEHELGVYERRLEPSDPLAVRLARAAREADFFHLPAVIGTPWPGANTRTLAVALGDQRHEVLMHLLSGLPEPLRLFEAALWDACASLRRHPIAALSAETQIAPRVAPGGGLRPELRLRRRGAMPLDFTPSESATVVVTQNPKTLLREGVRLEGEAWQKTGNARVTQDLEAPAFAGSYEVQVIVSGPIVFGDGESHEATLIAAPALLTVG